MRWAMLLVLLGGCPGGDTRVFSASYELSGHLHATRAIDDQSGGRVTCTVDVDPTDPIDPSPVFSLVIVSASDGRRQPGFHLTFHGWKGAGRYALGTVAGEALAYEEALATDCGRPSDSSCYTATEGCSLDVQTWDLGAVGAPGVANGTATGTVSCERLENPVTEETIKILDGKFTCRAADWSSSRR